MECSAAKYVIGLDFGSLSARGFVFSVRDGSAVCGSEFVYPKGILSEGTFAGHACEDPEDYLLALTGALRDLKEKSGVPAKDIIGIGIDCTVCSVLPVSADGEPLSGKFAGDPCAYVRMWKDHSALKYADRINAAAKESGAAWLDHCGGSVSPEWMLPKLLQAYEEAPEICEKAAYFMEAGDWLVMQLTGRNVRGSSAAGFVGNRMQQEDFPSDGFLESLSPGFAAFVKAKLEGEYLPMGACAGTLTEAMAEKLGFSADTAVACANIDAQAAFPSVPLEDGDVLAIMGTSTVFLTLSEEIKTIKGLSCVVKDGIIPGRYAWSAGQSCSGDLLEWYIRVMMPGEARDEAARLGLDPHAYLCRDAEKLRPGESGLLALDWVGGNRCILRDMSLTGVILGLSTSTKPFHIYRALIEATGFGSRKILELFRANGIGKGRLFMSGGIPRKNPMAMQIYADILGEEIYVLDGYNGPALGTAVCAAVAAGRSAGGFASFRDASGAMGCSVAAVYEPAPERAAVYEKLYAEYSRLHDLFGLGECDVLKRLSALKQEV